MNLTEIEKAKKIYDILSKEYKFNVPLQFKKLGNDAGGGYCEIVRVRGSKKKRVRKIVINTNLTSYDLDYIMVHEIAHVILCNKNNSTSHTKAHTNLTYKLARRFNLV